MALRDTGQHQHTDEVSTYVGDFILSITQAMREQLMFAIRELEPVKLDSDHLEPIQRRPGVYQLFLDGVSVYVGKAVDDLKGRLARHSYKLSGRYDPSDTTGSNLIDRMSFRCMYINVDIDALAPEKMMIQQFKELGEAPWNNSGFGNNDPGRERDTSTVKLAHFDRLYPINLDVDLTPKERMLAKGAVPINDLQEALQVIKSSMPFLMRYGQSHPNKKVFKSIDVTADNVAGTTKTVSGWLDWIADKLPAGWSITALPGYIISYEEADVSHYRSRTHAWHTNGGNHTVVLHQPVFTDGKVEDDDTSEGE